MAPAVNNIRFRAFKILVSPFCSQAFPWTYRRYRPLILTLEICVVARLPALSIAVTTKLNSLGLLDVHRIRPVHVMELPLFDALLRAARLMKVPPRVFATTSIPVTSTELLKLSVIFTLTIMSLFGGNEELPMGATI